MTTSPFIPHASLSFDDDGQRLFASLSGDHNPMHVDPVAARRSLYGRAVVHGVHGVLKALESWCGTLTGGEPTAGMSGMQRLTVDFVKPVFVGDDVVVSIADADGDRIRLHLAVDGVTVTTVRIDWGVVDVVETGPIRRGVGGSRSLFARDRCIEDLVDDAGEVTVPATADDWDAHFPSVCRLIGSGGVASVSALSTLVGMECPGLHSVFGGFSIGFRSSSPAVASEFPPAATVRYSVASSNPRFSTVKIAVDSAHFAGEVRAFVRPAPTVQASTNDIAHLVDPDEFARVSALIVGGSRGLGEIAAKLIAAGGGRPTITWHQGQSDAEHVVADIAAAGWPVDSIRLDVAEPDVPLDLPGAYTHVLFFASPRISSRRLSKFDRELFDGFVDVYVTGFLRIADAAVQRAPDVAVLYPSTVYVESGLAEFVEYAAAKAAGEAAANVWARAHRPAVVHVERLPPLATDQTAALIAGKVDATPGPVLAMLRSLQRAGAESDQ